ncbi:hypothetical protein [Thioalkalivibrio sp. ALJ15]|uniref:hypothetical protein n=1 Tax=Thioalkalivibrio sp. ALJ15 TaxID=748652 RepID=UPI000370C80F|nr:hypothetical protein [Thioalkalivibrio sp. ALJ15]
MKIEATLDDKGHLQFARPLKLRHPRVRVQVTVPDEEIEPEEEGATTGGQPPLAGHSGTAKSANFIARLQSTQAPIREALQSAENRALSKSEIRERRAQAWEDKHRG